MTREDLTADILAAGGVSCEHALKAATYSDGVVGLNDGVLWDSERRFGGL